MHFGLHQIGKPKKTHVWLCLFAIRFGRGKKINVAASARQRVEGRRSIDMLSILSEVYAKELHADKAQKKEEKPDSQIDSSTKAWVLYRTLRREVVQRCKWRIFHLYPKQTILNMCRTRDSRAASVFMLLFPCPLVLFLLFFSSVYALNAVSAKNN